MAGLKELRNRLESIKSTQKITSAMKMVAASRLRKAQLMLDRSECYSQTIHTAVKRILATLHEEEVEKNITYLLPSLLRQKPNAMNYLLFVFSSDRGLCGSYNQNVAKAAAKRIAELEASGRKVQVICYGKKAFDILKKRYADRIIEHKAGVAPKGLSYQEAIELGKKIGKCCDNNACDVCELVYSHFESALSRTMMVKQVYPLSQDVVKLQPEDEQLHRIGNVYYDFQPERFKLLESLLPKLIVDIIFTAMMNSQASEHGARMAAMDNATRNAKDMISNLTLKYNSIRQAAITTELTEIISGAESL